MFLTSDDSAFCQLIGGWSVIELFLHSNLETLIGLCGPRRNILTCFRSGQSSPSMFVKHFFFSCAITKNKIARGNVRALGKEVSCHG